jgi:membrane protein YqaA with SNARE-associated domain
MSNQGGNPRGLHHRLYRWVLHWADTRYGLPALIILAFAESSFFPVPPDVLLLPLCLGQPKRAFQFAFWCSLASVLGGMFGYLLGYAFWEAGVKELCFNYLFSEDIFAKVGTKFEEWNFWIVFTAGFSPIPYKVFTISAGVFHEHVSFPMFVIASAVSRSGRFFLEAVLLRAWGEQIRDFIEKRLALMSLLFCVCLVGGFAAIHYLL